MELAGIAKEDRIPSAEETDMLTQEMESFCSEFEEFEKRMLAKGIIVGKRIALSPPTAEYASVINVNDYDVDISQNISEINAVRRSRRKNEKKYSRRNEQ